MNSSVARVPSHSEPFWYVANWVLPSIETQDSLPLNHIRNHSPPRAESFHELQSSNSESGRTSRPKPLSPAKTLVIVQVSCKASDVNAGGAWLLAKHGTRFGKVQVVDIPQHNSESIYERRYKICRSSCWQGTLTLHQQALLRNHVTQRHFSADSFFHPRSCECCSNRKLPEPRACLPA